MNYYEAYMVSYLTMKGWELSVGDSSSRFTLASRVYWSHPELTEDVDSLEAAYNLQKKKDADTIPSPPPSEEGLYSILQDLCVTYDEGSDVPDELFRLIAEHIGYEGYCNLRKVER